MEQLFNTPEESVNPNSVRDAFGLHAAPVLVTRTLHKSAMAVTELRGDAPNFGRTQSMRREDAYLIALQMRECHDHDLYFDGRRVRPENFVAGVTAIYDLRRDPVADIRSPFHSLHFYLPRRVLDDIADEAEAPHIADLQHQPGVGVNDSVVRHLLLSLIPVMEKPEEANSVFVDHVALALSAHVAHVYGKMRSRRRPARGGLAPSQERRAKELLAASVDGDISLERLAAECGLSARHFARAFKRSTGVPPFRWLLKLRIERAKELLRVPSLSLADVAVTCGFTDQSHFTRVFVAATGLPPGTWRRMQG